MTIDDENSIYVGGLPYSATEDSVRRVFSLYGSIVAVKIINDRGTRGKCYCFVTFRNPRSVVDAINDMNGQTMDGRILRVNEVTSRGGRSNINGDRYQQGTDRGMDSRSRLDKGRKRDREYDLDRSTYRERFINKSRERDVSREFSEMRERAHGDVHDHDGMKDRFIESEGKDLVENKPEQQNNNDFDQERGRDVDWNQDMGMDGSNVNAKTIHEIDYDLRKGNSSYKDRCSRENSLDPGDDFDNEGKDRLERLIHKRNELRKEISRMEESLGEQHVLELQKKQKKVEEALSSARKLSAQRRKQLTKVYKSFLQVKTYAEKVKSSEQELQYLVDGAALESDAGDDLA